MLHFVDLIFLFMLFVVQPIYGSISYKKYLNGIAAGMEANRISLYRQTVLLQWIALLVLLTAWFMLNRPMADLGFIGSDTNEVLIGTVSMVIMLAGLIYGWQYVKRLTIDDKIKERESLGDLIHFLPQTQQEFKTCIGVSITAGIVEETIYRGFVLWALSLYMPLWMAVFVSSFAFGLAHSYQGLAGAVKVMCIGLVLAGLYVVTGSIWFPILAHILFDILQTASVRELFIERTPAVT